MLGLHIVEPGQFVEKEISLKSMLKCSITEAGVSTALISFCMFPYQAAASCVVD